MSDALQIEKCRRCSIAPAVEQTGPNEGPQSFRLVCPGCAFATMHFHRRPIAVAVWNDDQRANVPKAGDV